MISRFKIMFLIAAAILFSNQSISYAENDAENKPVNDTANEATNEATNEAANDDTTADKEEAPAAEKADDATEDTETDAANNNTVEAANTELQTVPNIDVSKYLGKWFEVARLPMFFERNCKYPITAEYSLREDGKLNVVNRCADENGEIDTSYGVAKQSFKDKNTVFTVNFLPQALQTMSVFISPNYYIIALTDDYEYALVGTPSRKFLWVLSRTDKPNKEIVEKFINQAKEQGFDVDKLIRVIE